MFLIININSFYFATCYDFLLLIVSKAGNMGERLAPQSMEQLLYTEATRRDVLKLFGAGLVLTEFKGLAKIGAEFKLNIHLLPPPLIGYPIKAGELIDGGLANVVLNKDFFLNTDPLIYGHRLGNQGIEQIDKAYRLGVNVFDIDANDMSAKINGGDVLSKVYAAHGHIVHDEDEIIAEIDPTELKIKFGKPLTVAEVAKHIASLSTPKHRLGLTIDLKKYGPLEMETLKELFNTVYGVLPTVFIPNGHGPELRKILEEREKAA